MRKPRFVISLVLVALALTGAEGAARGGSEDAERTMIIGLLPGHFTHSDLNEDDFVRQVGGSESDVFDFESEPRDHSQKGLGRFKLDPKNCRKLVKVDGAHPVCATIDVYKELDVAKNTIHVKIRVNWHCPQQHTWTGDR